MNKIDVIVPCYNEASRIGSVLEVLSVSPLINQIIVVDDASTDNSSEVASKFKKTKIIKLKKNKGKGDAVKKALNYITSNSIFICDADLRGLSEKHINEMVNEHYKDPEGFVVGFTERNKRYVLYWITKNLLLFEGQRVLSHENLREILNYEGQLGYGLEAWMNYCFKKKGKKGKIVILDGLKNAPTLRKGLRGHATEQIDIAKAYYQIYKVTIKDTIREQITSL